VLFLMSEEPMYPTTQHLSVKQNLLREAKGWETHLAEACALSVEQLPIENENRKTQKLQAKL